MNAFTTRYALPVLCIEDEQQSDSCLQRPFEGHSQDQLSTEIRFSNPRYPRTDPPIETSCTSAIQALLSRNLHDRIGANGFSTFTNHPFFVNAGIDFDLLERKGIRPIFVPSSDKTNFDATYDLEELLLEEAPLEARTKHNRARAEPKADASPQEKRAADLHRMIEQLFEPFDYTLATFDKVSGDAGEDPIMDPEVTISPEALTTIMTPSGQENTSPGPSKDFKPIMLRTPSATLVDDQGTGTPPLMTQASLPVLTETTSTATAAPPPPPIAHAPSAHAADVSRRLSGIRTRTAGPSTARSSDSASRQDRGRTSRKSVLGFLSSKKGKDGMPKKGEAGVLGKGARTIIGD